MQKTYALTFPLTATEAMKVLVQHNGHEILLSARGVEDLHRAIQHHTVADDSPEGCRVLVLIRDIRHAMPWYYDFVYKAAIDGWPAAFHQQRGYGHCDLCDPPPVPLRKRIGIDKQAGKGCVPDGSGVAVDLASL